jgi:hypothetical protein
MANAVLDLQRDGSNAILASQTRVIAPTLSSLAATLVTALGCRASVTISNAATGTLYLAVFETATTPTWNRANIGTNSGWSGSPVYHDADTDPGTGSTYQFVPDASGLTASTAYKLWAIWDDGAQSSSLVSSAEFTTLSAAITPDVGHILLTGYSTSLIQGKSVSLDVGHILLTGYAPTIGQGASVAPSAGHLVLTGYTPSISQGASVSPNIGHVVLTGYATSLVQGKSVSPSIGHALLTGYVPEVSQQSAVRPDVGHIVLSGYVPTIAQPKTIAPNVGHVLLSGYAPAIVSDRIVAPNAGHVLLSGYAPIIVKPNTVVPAVGHAQLSGHAPIVVQGNTITPGSFALYVPGSNFPLEALCAGDDGLPASVATSDAVEDEKLVVSIQMNLDGATKISGEVNSTALTLESNVTGVGPFENLSLHIGRRDGTSAAANMAFYGGVVRNTQSTAQEIALTKSALREKIGL